MLSLKSCQNPIALYTIQCGLYHQHKYSINHATLSYTGAYKRVGTKRQRFASRSNSTVNTQEVIFCLRMRAKQGQETFWGRLPFWRYFSVAALYKSITRNAKWVTTVKCWARQRLSARGYLFVHLAYCFWNFLVLSAPCYSRHIVIAPHAVRSKTNTW